jgi:N-acetylglucosaminyldiphosphoundecaprenol N-acetyl-beta-D-mannosaminyltransferase
MKILNIKNLNPNPIGDILAFCQDRLDNGQGAFLIPMNPIKVIKARSHTDFQKIIDSADWVFPDASGMRYAASILHGQEITTSAGYKVMFSLIGQAEKNNASIYILGTEDGILEVAKKKLLEKHPSLRIVGMHNGFFITEQELAIFKEITELRPDYVFVAMGEYKQEQVIERLRKVYFRAICMGVGGSIDLVAGKQPWPPAWVQKAGIEWLYRAVKQPFRIPRFKALPIFAALVLKARIFGSKA